MSRSGSEHPCQEGLQGVRRWSGPAGRVKLSPSPAPTVLMSPKCAPTLRRMWRRAAYAGLAVRAGHRHHDERTGGGGHRMCSMTVPRADTNIKHRMWAAPITYMPGSLVTTVAPRPIPRSIVVAAWKRNRGVHKQAPRSGPHASTTTDDTPALDHQRRCSSAGRVGFGENHTLPSRPHAALPRAMSPGPPAARPAMPLHVG